MSTFKLYVLPVWYSFVGSHFEQHSGTIAVGRTLTIELEFVMISAFFCILWIRVFFATVGSSLCSQAHCWTEHAYGY